MRLLLDMINWSFYNKSLVRRGEVILDFDVIDSWYSELDRYNYYSHTKHYCMVMRAGIDGLIISRVYAVGNLICFSSTGRTHTYLVLLYLKIF